MLLLAHLGYTTGEVRISQECALRRPLDYRLVVLMAILSDLIDRTPYALVIPGARSGRIYAHTLLFSLVLLAVLVAIRRNLWIFGLVPLAHLFLDLADPSVDQLPWLFLETDLSNVQISDGLGGTAGQPYGARVGDRIEDIFATYGAASVWSLLIDAGGLVAFAILAEGQHPEGPPVEFVDEAFTLEDEVLCEAASLEPLGSALILVTARARARWTFHQ